MFEQELETYRLELPNLLDQIGSFVVIHGDKVLGVYCCEHDAMLIGYEKVGLTTPFLCRKIALKEEVIITLFDRELFVCPDEPKIN